MISDASRTGEEGIDAHGVLKEAVTVREPVTAASIPKRDKTARRHRARILGMIFEETECGGGNICEQKAASLSNHSKYSTTRGTTCKAGAEAM